MIREHLFITTKHFENCHKFQIFGVGKVSINQFGLVNKGDNVFFINKNDNLVLGPYEVVSNIFYNEEIIWQEKNGIDAYPYRVRLKSGIIYAIDSNIFSQIVEEKGIRIDSRDLGQKSVFTFLPKDVGSIENRLKEEGEEIKKSIEKKEFQEREITIELAQNHGFTEAFLEFFLLKDFIKFFRFGSVNLIPYNQFRINLFGSRIDIIAISEKYILVIELKKDVIEEKNIRQLQDYFLWAKNNKVLLERFFNTKLDNPEIRGYIIGSEVQRDISTNSYGFSLKKYSLDFENNKILLSDM